MDNKEVTNKINNANSKLCLTTFIGLSFIVTATMFAFIVNGLDADPAKAPPSIANANHSGDTFITCKFSV